MAAIYGSEPKTDKVRGYKLAHGSVQYVTKRDGVYPCREVSHTPTGPQSVRINAALHDTTHEYSDTRRFTCYFKESFN